MAAPIGAVHMAMSAGAAQFERDMGRAKRSVKKNATGMQRAMFQAKRGFDAALKSIKLMSVAAIAGAAIITRMIKKQIDFADAAQKTAEGIGVTVEELTALKHAADLSGVSFEGLQKGMKAITKRSADAAAGMLEYKEVFDLLEIDVLNLDGTLKSSGDLILEVADKFVTFKDSAAKTALALELFGKSGADLIPLLNAGSLGIKEMTDEAVKLGLVLDTETAEGAERFNDNLTRMGGLFTGIFLSTLPAILPILERYTNDMVDAAIETNELGKAGESAASGLQVMLSSLTAAVGVVNVLRNELAGTAVTLIEFFKGNFKTAFFINEETVKETKNLFKEMVDDITRIYEELPEKVKNATKDLIDAPVLTPKLTTKVTDAEKEKLRLQKEGIATTRALRDETEIYNDEMLRLFRLYDAGNISLETYNRGMTKAAETLKKAGKEVDDLGDRFDELNMTINGWARDSADAILEFTKGGKDAFKNMADSIIDDMLRMMIQKTITDKLFGFLGGFFSGGGGAPAGNATGGSVSSNSLYEVNERRPEIFNLGGRQFLSTASMNGRVIPNTDSVGGGLTISVPITIANRNPAMQAELRREMEITAENVLRRHS